MTPGISLIVRALALLEQPSTRRDKLADALIAAQRSLNGMLRWHVSAQTHRGQHLQTFDIAFGVLLRSVQYHPAAETGHAVGFGQPVEGHGQQIRCQRGNRMMLGFVIQNLVVDLVGEDDQVMLAGDLHDLQQQLFTVHRTGRVVGVDDHDPAGTRCDLLRISSRSGNQPADSSHR